jgi:oxygen-dependent protoporphyrinogen oxidase
LHTGRRPRVAVIGGGISGLTVAYALERDTDCEIVLLEASERTGGKIRTREIELGEGRLTVEAGADALFSRKPWAIDLAVELGLEPEIVSPKANEFSMLIGGRLHRVPAGLVSLTSADPAVVMQADFLTEEGKRRALAEGDAPVGTDEDESIASFFRRRFGEEFSRLVAEPLLAGTHGGLPEELSVRALYGAYFDMERRHGSLSAAMAGRPAAPTSSPERPAFVSFRVGMEALVRRLAESLSRTQARLESRVESIDLMGGHYLVRTATGAVEADSVVLALPANAAARLLTDLAPRASDDMSSIVHASSAIVTLAYRNDLLANPIAGTGFLVPYGEECRVTGATWSSSKWPNRAPDGCTLVRVFLGRKGRVDIENSNNEDLISISTEEFGRIAAPRGNPLFAHVDKWTGALPQYTVGHLSKVERIEASLSDLPGLYVTGTSYRGVGIPDCVRQGFETVRKLKQEIISL